MMKLQTGGTLLLSFALLTGCASSGYRSQVASAPSYSILSPPANAQREGKGFVDVAAESGIDIVNAISAGWADFNNDGCQDLLFTRADGPVLYRNNCDRTFSEITESSGITGPASGVGVAWADYDGDGFSDVYIASDGEANRLYRNLGNGRFEDVTERAGVGDTRSSIAGSWADFDADGDLDLYVANRFYATARSSIADRLYRNNGDGSFTDVAVETGLAVEHRKSFMGAWFDYDGNGTQDLYLAVDFKNDVLYANDGRGGFTDVTRASGIRGPAHAMGLAVGDINGDGCLDIVSTNNTQLDDADHGPSTLYLNNCDGTFTDATRSWGIEDRKTVDWGANLVDWDNDGDQDLSIVSGGMIPNSENECALLYENTGRAPLKDVTLAKGAGITGASFGSAWADYDNDGDLDWLIVNSKARSVLLENRNPQGNRLDISLLGGGDNLQAVGARIEITADGKTQVAVIQAGKSYGNSEPTMAHFGLGSTDRVHLLKVFWPDGSVTRIQNPPVNRVLQVRKD